MLSLTLRRGLGIATRAACLVRHHSTYHNAFAASVNPETREAFWSAAAAEIDWVSPPEQILTESNVGSPQQRWGWFGGGELNTSFNCLDRHVNQGRGEQTALIFHSAMQGKQESISYSELTDRVATMAGVLADSGVKKGDVVVIYMPMVPEAIVSMLACARLGAIHNVVFGGFAAKQLAARIEDSTPKVIISASCGLEPGRVVEYKPLLDEAIALSPHKPDRCVILQRGEAEATMDPLRDVDWAVANAAAVPHPPVPVLAEDPLYVIYTSGTTGQPKAIQRENGGHAVALNWSMPAIYGCDAGDTWWAASDVGWVVGSSYICYGPLLRGCTTVLYEGKPVGTPDAGEFWRVISQNRVKSMFTAPTAIRAIKAADSNGEFLQDLDMTSLKALFLAGERSDPATIEWAQELLGIPVIDHWWQTETGFPITSNYMGYDGPFPIKPGSSTFPVPGWDVTVLNENTGELAGRNELGQLAVKLPLPPCAFTTLFRDEERFETSYLTDYPGYYNTGDAGHIDDDGYVSIMTRTDDIINVAGHRLSTGGMEQVLAQHPAVAECAVIGISDEIKGLSPLGLVVLKQTAIDDDQDQISRELIAMVRAQIGPVAAFKHALCVQVLPKVKSGKILRKTMKAIFDNREYAFPGNIEDPAVLTYIEEVATDFAKSQV